MTKTFPTTSTIIQGIPVDLWREAKAKARREGYSMRALLLTLLKQWLER